MTNKQIAEKIAAAGHDVPAGLNRAKLEALAAEKGVSLEEAPTGQAGQRPAPPVDEDGLSRLITPQMACSVFPGPGEAPTEAADA